jgi:putative ABC transport system permease protein
MLRDHFKLAIKNLRARLSRSLLTLLGIAIGIMAIVSLMGLGEGMQQAVTGQLSSLSDTIIVNAGSSGGLGMLMGDNGGSDAGKNEYLTDRDLADIQRIQGVKEVSPELSGTALGHFDNKNAAVSISGVDYDVMLLQYGSSSLEAGTLLSEGAQNQAVIGYSVAHSSFDVNISIGNMILLNGEKFSVTGIFAKQGMGGITSTDGIVLLTPRDFKKITGQSNISMVTVSVYDVTEVNAIADSIKQTVNENHGMKDFVSVITMSSVLKTIQNIIGIIQMVLIAIASIALIVASIGIMNTMLTSVMERTREIGIMKAIGATNVDIMSIFIIEGMLVSSVGGIIGIILGSFGSQAMSVILMRFMSVGSGANLAPVITIASVVLGISVSLIVGILSSLYPAWKAARMSPIEAVRYE